MCKMGPKGRKKEGAPSARELIDFGARAVGY